MAVFKITDPNTGKTVKLTSADNTPPTEQELEEVFSNVSGGQKQQSTPIEQKPTPIEQIATPEPQKKGLLRRGAESLLDVAIKSAPPTSGIAQGLKGLRQIEPIQTAEEATGAELLESGLERRKPDIIEAVKEKKEFGDVLEKRGATPFQKKAGGLALSMALPSNLLLGLGISKADLATKGGKQAANIAQKVGGAIVGIDREIIEETAKKGFKSVLKSKFLNKKLPIIIQNTIDDNIDELSKAASQQFDEATKTVRNIKINNNVIKNKIIEGIKGTKFFKATKENRLLRKVLNVVDNSEFNNMGDLLDFRRELDDLIFGETKRKVGTKSIKLIRDKTRDFLHKNDLIRKADEAWTNLSSLLKDTQLKKITSETGENVLKRFNKLTDRQKRNLSLLEKKIGGTPFVEDLTNFSLAQEFLGKGGIKDIASKAIYRGLLRTGESISPITKTTTPAKGIIGMAIEPSIRQSKKVVKGLLKNDR